MIMSIFDRPSIIINGFIINTINKVTWNKNKNGVALITKRYKKEISIGKEDIKLLEKKHYCI